MSKFKKLTHFLFVGLAAAAAFGATPAGQALVHQYPVLSGIFAVLGIAGAVYHDPVKP